MQLLLSANHIPLNMSSKATLNIIEVAYLSYPIHSRNPENVSNISLKEVRGNKYGS